jgi:hypothetical protein
MVHQRCGDTLDALPQPASRQQWLSKAGHRNAKPSRDNPAIMSNDRCQACNVRSTCARGEPAVAGAVPSPPSNQISHEQDLVDLVKALARAEARQAARRTLAADVHVHSDVPLNFRI